MKLTECVLVQLQSAVSVCCPGQPVSSVSELKTVQHRLFIWICTFNRDEASQIHVVDVTVPVHAKVTETFVVSDSNVPAMAFVPTVAAKGNYDMLMLDCNWNGCIAPEQCHLNLLS